MTTPTSSSRKHVVAGMEPLAMDQTQALEMTRNGATLLCVGVPAHTQLGIDLITYVIGPKFLGVKMIPAGVHYIHYAPSSATSGTAPRSGLFVHFQPSQVYYIIVTHCTHHMPSSPSIIIYTQTSYMSCWPPFVRMPCTD
jgi:hypothetical protein